MADLLPTVPGKTRGIVALDPFTLQCGVCGTTKANDGAYRGRDGTFLVLSGYLFCLAEKGTGPRRCPDCRAKHAATCSRCES